MEITVLRSTRQPETFLLCFVNQQDELPPIPVHELQVRLVLPQQFKPKSCTTVSDGRAVQWHDSADGVIFRLPRLETVEMIQIQTQER